MMMLIALLAAISGYYFFYILRIRKNVAYFPILMISGITIAIYIAGMLGHLHAGIYAVLAVGCALLAVDILLLLRGERVSLLHAFINPTTALMVIGCIWLYFITRDTSLSHYDDFSHWYRICKMMYAEGAYPSNPDLFFPSYVPGTATWIYFFTSFSGFSVANCFFAQSLIHLCCCASFLSAVPQKTGKLGRLLALLYTGVVAVLLCAMNISTYALLVDSVVALVPMAVFIMIWNEKTYPDYKMYLLLLLATCFTALIKTSGLLFVLFIAIAWFTKYAMVDKEKACAAHYWKGLALVAVPFLCMIFYVWRSSVVFGNLSVTRQGVSVARYLSVFNEKSIDEMLEICGKFISDVVIIEGAIPQIKIIWLCLSLAGAACLVCRCFRRSEMASVKYITLYLLSFSVIYGISLLLTYLFSMERVEANAVNLACFYRYIGTAAQFIAGSLAYGALYEIMRMSAPKRELALYLSVMMVYLVGTSYFDFGYIWGSKYYQPEEKYTTRAWELCNEYATENWYYNDDCYVVLWDPTISENTYNTYWMMTTYLRSVNVQTYKIQELIEGRITDEQKAQMMTCDCLVTLGDFSSISDVIAEYLPEKAIKSN